MSDVMTDMPSQREHHNRPPMSARMSAASVTSRRSAASSAFSGVLDPGFANLFHYTNRNRSSAALNLARHPAAAAAANASSLPDFAFLGYANLPTTAAELGVADEASWSYSGPLLGLTADADGRMLPESFYEFARSALTCALPLHLRPARGYYSDTEEEGETATARGAHGLDPADVLAAVLVPFLLFANRFLAANGVHHYWVTVRSTRPSHEFDVPRWHTDDFFWDTFRNLRRPQGPCKGECEGPDSTKQPTSGDKKRSSKTTPKTPPNTHQKDLATDWKLCTTLLGPPTLFLPEEYQAAARGLQKKARALAARNHACATIRCVGCTTAAQAVRDVMNRETDWMGVMQHARLLSPANRHHQRHRHHDEEEEEEEGRLGASGQCAFFRIGADRGAVHSEPPITEDRIFVNVVPAREDELAKLMARWGMAYPRDWWVGTEAVRRWPTGGK